MNTLVSEMNPEADEILPPLTREEAKRLADLHLALAQEYRKLAGIHPVPTGRHQRKVITTYNQVDN